MNAGDSLIFTFSNIHPKSKNKIKAQSHFNIPKQPHGSDPPTYPRGKMTPKPVRQPMGVMIFTANPLTPRKKN